MYNVMLFYFMLIIFLSLLTLMLYFLSMKTFMDWEKSTFECGFDLFESPRIPFSSHFFLLAFIFLIFDVELVIMPSTMMMQMMSILNILCFLTIIVILLLIGLYREWNNNMLNWIWEYI